MADRPLIPARDRTGRIVERPMTDDEFAEWQAGAGARDEDALEVVRGGVRARLLAQLAATDQWIIRAQEEGRALDADRKAYRQQIRDLLAELQTSADPGAVAVPESPPFVQGPPVPDAGAVADAAAAAVNVTAAALAPGTAADQRAVVVDDARSAAAAALERP